MNLESSLRHHQEAIDNVLSMIPSKYYIHNDQEPTLNQKYMKNKKTKSQIKSLSKTHKTTRLDPESSKTIESIQQSLSNEKKLEKDSSTDKIVKLIQPFISMQDLKQKLHDKIQFLQQKRNRNPVNRNEILERRLGKQGNKTTGNKRKHVQVNDNDTTAVNSEEDIIEKKQKIGGVMFGNIGFGENGKKKQGLDTLSKLKKAESQKLKLESVYEKVPEKAQEIQIQEKWKKLELLAQGQKVLDDPKLIKKTLKREQKQKQKSEIQWKGRKEHQENQIEMKIKKRTENIQQRKDKKKGGKGKKEKKRPGFEGKANKLKK